MEKIAQDVFAKSRSWEDSDVSKFLLSHIDGFRIHQMFFVQFK
jgi:hypothetical protein